MIRYLGGEQACIIRLPGGYVTALLIGFVLIGYAGGVKGPYIGIFLVYCFD